MCIVALKNGEGEESRVYDNTPATSTTPTQSPEYWRERRYERRLGGILKLEIVTIWVRG